MEHWKAVVGYEGLYEVSSLGRIRSLDRVVKGHIGEPKKIKGTVLAQGNRPNGYLGISLAKNGKKRTQSMHRIVALTHIPNPENKPQLNHIDNNRSNNCVNNLEWCTARENIQHGIRQDRNSRGERNHLSKLKPEQVIEIRELRTQGLTFKEIGKKFGVNQQTAWDIVKGRSWKHLIKEAL